jgi:hypothetical protein
MAISPVALILALSIVIFFPVPHAAYAAPLVFIYVALRNLRHSNYVAPGSRAWHIMRAAAWIGPAILVAVILQFAQSFLLTPIQPIHLEHDPWDPTGNLPSIAVDGLDFNKPPVIEKDPGGRFGLSYWTKFGNSGSEISDTFEWIDDGDGHRVAARMAGPDQIDLIDRMGNSVSISWPQSGPTIIASKSVGQSSSIRKPIPWIATLAIIGEGIMFAGPIATLALLSLAIGVSKGLRGFDQFVAAGLSALSIAVWIPGFLNLHPQTGPDYDPGFAALATLVIGSLLLGPGLLILCVRLLREAFISRKPAG